MIQLLESRRLYAVSVVEGFPGFYEVTGDDSDDAVIISIDQPSRQVTINGVGYGHASYVTVYGLGGNDTVSISGSGGGPVGASVLGGGGNDTITLNNVSGAAWGDDGDDRIELSDSFRGEAYGGDGADYVSLKGACVDARVHGGPGNDTLVGSANGAPVFFFGEGGWDRLYGSPFGDILDGGPDRDMMFGNAGDDQFYARDGASDWIIGGEGNDTAICDELETSTTGTEFLLTD